MPILRGHELNIDADYGAYRNRSEQYSTRTIITTRPTKPKPIYSRIYFMNAPTDINLYSAKADYEQGFKKG